MAGDSPPMRQIFLRLLLSGLVLLSVAALPSCVGLKASNVNPVPTVSIAANPASIFPGQSVSLTWTSANAGSAMIDNGIGASQPSGSITVTPTTTTTYTITASGPGGSATSSVTVTVTTAAPTVSITASPTSVAQGRSSVLTVVATDAMTVVVTENTDSTSHSLSATGGTLTVIPSSTTTYTATATGANNQTTTATATVTVTPANVQAINHIIFMLQENRTFDSYFGMLNPYRSSNGWTTGDDGKTYTIDGIDDKLTKFTNVDDEGTSFSLFKLSSSCIDDATSAWLESYGDVSRYDFTTSRSILMDGFVHTAENYAKGGFGQGTFTDLQGQRAMGYYDQDFLNYYYYMASQFTVSDRWFSPVSSESIPNRIATMTGGTTQGLVRDPGADDKLGQLNIQTIFQKLDTANVSWKIYYTITQGQCVVETDGDCGTGSQAYFPATTFTYFSYSQNYLYENPTGAACTGTTEGSLAAVGDPSNAFCIDPNKIAPLSQYFTDVQNGTLPSFSYIEAGYGINDEHPGSGQSILTGQSEVASIINPLMASTSWKDSAFFFSYDEAGGPFDHVPPVPGHTNDNTDTSSGITTDISSIAVNADSYKPCLAPNGVPTTHCDLKSTDPGANPNDVPAVQGFAGQLGFRLPNFIVSPFALRHYVSHTPMDHTAVLKFVEDRFIGDKNYLTARDAAQPDLTEFFDFVNTPWATPPQPPDPVTPAILGSDPCHADSMGP
jgi:phospholipase C